MTPAQREKRRRKQERRQQRRQEAIIYTPPAAQEQPERTLEEEVKIQKRIETIMTLSLVAMIGILVYRAKTDRDLKNTIEATAAEFPDIIDSTALGRKILAAHGVDLEAVQGKYFQLSSEKKQHIDQDLEAAFPKSDRLDVEESFVTPAGDVYLTGKHGVVVKATYYKPKLNDRTHFLGFEEGRGITRAQEIRLQQEIMSFIKKNSMILRDLQEQNERDRYENTPDAELRKTLIKELRELLSKEQAISPEDQLQVGYNDNENFCVIRKTGSETRYWAAHPYGSFDPESDRITPQENFLADPDHPEMITVYGQERWGEAIQIKVELK